MISSVSSGFPAPSSAAPIAADAARPPAGPWRLLRWVIAAWSLLMLLAAPVALAQPHGGGDDPGANGAPFVMRAMGLCLEVNEPQLRVDGGRVQLGRCDGGPHQAWRRDRGWLVNLANGRCLDVHGPDAGLDGARVQVVNCSGATNQQWRQERGQFIVRVDERCLETVHLDSVRSAPTVQAWACNAERVQRWRLAALPAPAAPPAPPPVVRAVEAGPLYGNAEADRKCPAVCRPGRWNGQWVTTVPGRMSVCSCVFEAAAATPTPPPAPLGPPSTQAMSPERFDELLRLLEEEAFPTNALRTLQTVSRDHRFSVEQVQRLFKLFSFGSDRLRAMDITLPRLTDRANAYLLLGEFSFEIERAEARKLLERPTR